MHRGFVSGAAVNFGSDDAFAVSNTYHNAGADFCIVTRFQLRVGAPVTVVAIGIPFLAQRRAMPITSATGRSILTFGILPEVSEGRLATAKTKTPVPGSLMTSTHPPSRPPRCEDAADTPLPAQ